MTALSITPRTGTVERALLNGGFDRNAFLDAARLVKGRVEAERRTAERARSVGKGASPSR